MKTIVVLSDTHGSWKSVQDLRGLFEENDIVVHLGDGAADMRAYVSENPDKYFVCQGNCDYARALPETVIEVERLRIFAAHGHQYGVKSTRTTLARRAKELGCDIALYGHTHTPLYEEIDGVACLNPGTLKAPISSGGTYLYLVINGEKYTHVLVGEPLR